MEINRDNLANSPTTAPVDREGMVFDRDTTALDRNSIVSEPERGRTNFAAFLIGGVVIALGLLAFLFYDGANTGREVNTTGSTTPRIEAPATPASPANPSRPANPPAPAR
ncbi:MAG: hypothetical protein AVDCRST_MAG90-776 [uncultured Microvirga sp.]|uniref:Uncharacterized protein n=1 Tax=uncultured Microvirga sp. TaxID=412392 RepID=A0A6J4KVI5_9HYPH|nr:MAG: hypothetical protein AVDCRST_MAG90-776 [uncultured Microvirga sp.]